MSDVAVSRWLRGAAVYNLLWGAATILFPGLAFEALHLRTPNYLMLWQVVGMFVLVYAPAYWWAAGDVIEHRHLLVIATLGKILGPLGFSAAVLAGQAPWAFVAVIVTNDLIWWPVLFTALRRGAAASGGWARLAAGH